MGVDARKPPPCRHKDHLSFDVVGEYVQVLSYPDFGGLSFWTQALPKNGNIDY